MKNGEFIRELRLKRNLSQAELGRKINATRQHVNNLENSEDFNFSTLQKIVEALDMKIMVFPKEDIKLQPVHDN